MSSMSRRHPGEGVTHLNTVPANSPSTSMSRALLPSATRHGAGPIAQAAPTPSTCPRPHPRSPRRLRGYRRQARAAFSSHFAQASRAYSPRSLDSAAAHGVQCVIRAVGPWARQGRSRACQCSPDCSVLPPRPGEADAVCRVRESKGRGWFTSSIGPLRTTAVSQTQATAFPCVVLFCSLCQAGSCPGSEGSRYRSYRQPPVRSQAQWLADPPTGSHSRSTSAALHVIHWVLRRCRRVGVASESGVAQQQKESQ